MRYKRIIRAAAKSSMSSSKEKRRRWWFYWTASASFLPHYARRVLEAFSWSSFVLFTSTEQIAIAHSSFKLVLCRSRLVIKQREEHKLSKRGIKLRSFSWFFFKLSTLSKLRIVSVFANDLTSTFPKLQLSTNSSWSYIGNLSSEKLKTRLVYGPSRLGFVPHPIKFFESLSTFSLL